MRGDRFYVTCLAFDLAIITHIMAAAIVGTDKAHAVKASLRDFYVAAN